LPNARSAVEAAHQTILHYLENSFDNNLWERIDNLLSRQIVYHFHCREENAGREFVPSAGLYISK
jgi:hypothetical protein